MIFLHIGAMKTGTTFLQHLMEANQEELLAAGLLVAGDRGEQKRATSDVLGTSHKTPQLLAECEGAWAELVGRMFAHKGTASAFSMEFLSYASAETAAKVVDTLEGAEVHIILTVRDTVSALPSQWQTFIRSGGAVPWPKFAKGIRKGLRPRGTPRGRAVRAFLRTQGIPRMIEAWGGTVPPERLHVITVPRSGSDPMLLWKRFAGVVGVDPSACPNSTPRTNPTLGYPSADLMCRLNIRLGKLPREQYRPTLKAALGMDILGERAHLEQRPQIDLATARFAAGWNRRVRRAIRESGADVVGGLRELPNKLSPEVVQSLPRTLGYPDESDTLSAAATARDGLLKRITKHAVELESVGAQEVDLAPADFAQVPTTAGRWVGEPDPVNAAVEELSSLVLIAIDLRTRLEEARVLAGTGPRST